MITAIICMLVSPFVMLYYGIKILFRRLPKGIKALKLAFSNLPFYIQVYIGVFSIVVLVVSSNIFVFSFMVRDTPMYNTGERVEIIMNGVEGQVLQVRCVESFGLRPCEYNVRLPNLRVEDFTSNELRKKEYKPMGVTE